MMNFRIAGTFTSSLARLTGDEQKAVKTTAFDLRLVSVSPLQQNTLTQSTDDKFSFLLF